MPINRTFNLKSRFSQFSTGCAKAAGSPWAFVFAILLIIVWASFGPAYHWSSEHSLFINSSTTIITFLMVFIIQAAQNRDSKIARIERQSILRAIDQAPDTLIGLEKESDEKIGEIQAELHQVRSDADEA